MNIFYIQETTKMNASNNFIHKILTFIYSIAHQIGIGAVKIIHLILPKIEFPDNLIDPIGFLCILTLFLVLMQVAKKIAWIIVIVGWVLLFVRLLMIIFKIG